MTEALSLTDDRWERLEGAYREPLDVRPLLLRLESADDRESVWREIWQEMYHQGDIGESAFAAVPHLVRIDAGRDGVDWNIYAFVASVELARGVGQNPDVPAWARRAYELALRTLADRASKELPRAGDQSASRSILAFLAIVYGARIYGRVLLEYSEAELTALHERLP